MSSKAINLVLEERKVIGKGLNELRRSGKIPAVVHDHGKPSLHVMGDSMAVLKTYQSAGKHHPVEIGIGEDTHLALIRQVDFDPVKNDIRHIVFQAIKQNETVEAEVPVHLTTDIPAERVGLMVIKQLDHVTIEALPRDLVDMFEVDASKLEAIGDNLLVSDIIVPPNVTIMTDPTMQIAIIEEPKVQVIEEPEAEEGAEGEEGEEAAEGEEAPAEGEAKTEEN